MATDLTGIQIWDLQRLFEQAERRKGRPPQSLKADEREVVAEVEPITREPGADREMTEMMEMMPAVAGTSAAAVESPVAQHGRSNISAHAIRYVARLFRCLRMAERTSLVLIDGDFADGFVARGDRGRLVNGLSNLVDRALKVLRRTARAADLGWAPIAQVSALVREQLIAAWNKLPSEAAPAHFQVLCDKLADMRMTCAHLLLRVDVEADAPRKLLWPTQPKSCSEILDLIDVVSDALGAITFDPFWADFDTDKTENFLSMLCCEMSYASQQGFKTLLSSAPPGTADELMRCCRELDVWLQDVGHRWSIETGEISLPSLIGRCGAIWRSINRLSAFMPDGAPAAEPGRAELTPRPDLLPPPDWTIHVPMHKLCEAIGVEDGRTVRRYLGDALHLPEKSRLWQVNLAAVTNPAYVAALAKFRPRSGRRNIQDRASSSIIEQSEGAAQHRPPATRYGRQHEKAATRT